MNRTVDSIALMIAPLWTLALFVGFLRSYTWGLADVVGAVVVTVVALAATDLLSGVVHWAFDNRGTPETPVLGPMIEAFRDHHVRPTEIVEHDIVTRHGANCIGVLLVLVAATASSGLIQLFFLVVASAVGLTNQVHAWSHMSRVPRLVAALQRRGIILSPSAHARHHQSHDRAYCITTGWMNPVLDRVLRRTPSS